MVVVSGQKEGPSSTRSEAKSSEYLPLEVGLLDDTTVGTNTSPLTDWATKIQKLSLKDKDVVSVQSTPKACLHPSAIKLELEQHIPSSTREVHGSRSM